MARFLSSEWIDEAGAATRSSVGLAAATAGAHLTVQQIVTDGPEGDVHYVVSIDDGQVNLRAGDAATADVTFTLEWVTAVAMAKGALGAQEAFTTGRLALEGDVGARSVTARHWPASTRSSPPSGSGRPTDQPPHRSDPVTGGDRNRWRGQKPGSG